MGKKTEDMGHGSKPNPLVNAEQQNTKTVQWFGFGPPQKKIKQKNVLRTPYKTPSEDTPGKSSHHRQSSCAQRDLSSKDSSRRKPKRSGPRWERKARRVVRYSKIIAATSKPIITKRTNPTLGLFIVIKPDKIGPP